MGSPSQVRAGKTLERWTCRWLKGLGHKQASRSHQDRQGSHEKGSVPDVLGVPLWIECKRLKDAKLDAALTLVRKAWQQALADRDRAGSNHPVLIVASCGRTGALKLLAMSFFEPPGTFAYGPRIIYRHREIAAPLLVTDFSWETAREIETWIRGLEKQ